MTISKFSYWLDGVGFISREEVKRLITDGRYNFTGLHRVKGAGIAVGFVYYNKSPRALEIRDFTEDVEDKTLREDYPGKDTHKRKGG